jgi:hypothetical protein
MTTVEFISIIFSSNYRMNADISTIQDIAWMLGEKMIAVSAEKVATNKDFHKRIEEVSDPKAGLVKTGESFSHMALKSFAKDLLKTKYHLGSKDIFFEQPLVGFEVDVIDKNHHFPIECGDTNAQKLEKYLELSQTKEFILVHRRTFRRIPRQL